MNWIEWMILTLRALMLIGGTVIAIIGSRHYRKGEYQQAIYSMLFLIFIVLCVR